MKICQRCGTRYHPIQADLGLCTGCALELSPCRAPHSTTVWQGTESPKCDIHASRGYLGVEALYDGKTNMGPWACMCQACYNVHGIGLGLGKGQKYVPAPPPPPKPMTVGAALAAARKSPDHFTEELKKIWDEARASADTEEGT